MAEKVGFNSTAISACFILQAFAVWLPFNSLKRFEMSDGISRQKAAFVAVGISSNQLQVVAQE